MSLVKTEVCCDFCGVEFVVVSKFDVDPKFCAYCSEILERVELDDEEVEDDL